MKHETFGPASAVPVSPSDRAPARPLLLATLLSVAGLCGVASLLLVPFETLLPPGSPAFPIRLLALIQPAALTVLAAAAGAWLSAGVKLEAPVVVAALNRRPLVPVFWHQLPAAVAGGALVAAMLLIYQPTAGAIVDKAMADAGIHLQLPLLSRVLYGGITEEILTRWGLMTVVVWILVSFTRLDAGARWGGIAVAAAIFAAGHLPIILFAGIQSPILIAAILGANFIPGCIFGWLFWRRGLEAAIMAHMLAHFLAAAAVTLIA